MAFCGNCGAELVQGEAFCRACGTAVSAAPSSPRAAEPPERRTGRIALIVGAVVLGLALVIGAAVFVGRSMWNQGGPAASSTSAESSSTTSAASDSSTTTVSPPPIATPPETPPTNTTSVKPLATANDVTHEATFITKTGVADGGANTITFDYVQFLTGSAATKAAKAHGDTAENDYYVVNDNSKLRAFPVASGIVIKLHPGDGPSYSRIFSFAEFKKLVSDGSATYSGRMYSWGSDVTYYINVKNGKVTRVENQWVP